MATCTTSWRPAAGAVGGAAALDEGLEFMLYQLVRTELPDTILVSVSHRTTVEQHHTHELELVGDGEWRLGRVQGDEPVPV